MTQQYHVSIPRYEMMFSGSDFSSSQALAHAREQMVQFVVRGAMTDASDAPGAVDETDEIQGGTSKETQTEG